MPIFSRRERLRLSLWGLQQQTDKDFELHIVNDGGDPSLEEFVIEQSNGLQLHYHYLNPPSDKFRAAAARNLGIKHCSARRILCIDSDVIPEPDVVKLHKQYGSEPTIVCGLRKRISIEHVEKLIQAHDISYQSIERLVSAKDDRYRTDGWRLERSKHFQDMIKPGKKFPILCHSFHISYPSLELKEIGGFWEKFIGYGREDQELAHRLCSIGCTTLLDEKASVYHLDHELAASINSWFTQKLIQWRYQRSLKMKSPIRNRPDIFSR